jgi:hypothetical protein
MTKLLNDVVVTVNKNKLLIILLFAFVIRLVWGILAYNRDIMENYVDDKLYDNIALEINEKGLLHYQDNGDLAFLIISPGLPAILAMIKLLFGNSWLIVFVLNSLVSSLLGLFIYKIVIMIGDNKLAIFSALWSAIYILHIRYVPTAGKEIWISFMFLLTFWYFIHYLFNKKYNYANLLIFAIIFVLLVFIDERYLSYIPVFAIFFVLFRPIEFTFSKAVFSSALFLIFTGILIAPWIYRTYLVTDEVLILTPRTAHLTSQLFGTESKYSNYMPSFTEGRWYISPQKIDSIKSGHKNIKDNNGRFIPDEMYDAVINHDIIPYKFTYMENVLANLRSLWKPVDFIYGYTTGGYRFDGKWPLKTNLTVGLTYGLLLIFSILGWIALYKKNKKTAILFAAILIYHTLIHVIFIPFTRFRYRVPIDFIIIILGSYGMWISCIYIKVRCRFNKMVLINRK